jgi:hypothetical protein
VLILEPRGYATKEIVSEIHFKDEPVTTPAAARRGSPLQLFSVVADPGVGVSVFVPMAAVRVGKTEAATKADAGANLRLNGGVVDARRAVPDHVDEGRPLPHRGGE